MIVVGEYVFSGPRESVWHLLQDPAVLVKAMPGARQLLLTGDGVYEGVVRIGVGPVTAAEWKMTVVVADRMPPESYSMQVESKGPIGFTRGSARVELLADAGGTRMRYHADLQVGGKVAGVGQRLLDQVAKLLTKQGLNALSREMAIRLTDAPPPAAVVVDDANPATEPVGGPPAPGAETVFRPRGDASADADASGSADAGAADSAETIADVGAEPPADGAPGSEASRSEGWSGEGGER